VKRLALALLAACSGQPHGVHRAERVIASPDMTLRERSDGLTEILVVRAQGDVRAPGDATVRGAPAPHVRLAGARAWLAVSQLATGADAYAAVKAGLAELGNDYAPRGAIDDTTSLLRIAESADDPMKAADAARKALVDRIAMYVRRYREEFE
jgi:hypothetical protein